MGPRVGLIGQRAELVVEATAAVTAAGGEIHLPWDPGGAAPPSSGDRGWPAGARLDLVLVDVCGVGAVPSDVPTVVLCRAGEEEQARGCAGDLRAEAVVVLPDGTPWLQARLQPAAPEPPALAVLGAAGGVGASTVAIAAAVAAPDAVLVDLDPDGPGIALPLGLDDGVAGVSWSELPDARAQIDRDSLLAVLPTTQGRAVISGPPAADAGSRVGPVLSSLRSGEGRLVADLGRRDHFGALRPDDVLVIVVPGSVGGVVTARRLVANARVARVVLAVRDTGWVPRAQVPIELGGLPSVTVPSLRRAAELAECGQLLSGATLRSLRGFGEQLWAAAT